MCQISIPQVRIPQVSIPQMDPAINAKDIVNVFGGDKEDDRSRRHNTVTERYDRRQ